MAYFEPAVVTRIGVNMIANDIAGIGNIEFVKMVSGAGEYTEEEHTKNALEERTALKDPRQEFIFSTIEVKEERAVLLKSVISNQTLKEGYRITEVGIYAREKGTEGEGFLYSMSLAIEADFLPPFNGLAPIEVVQEYYTTVSDSAAVSIVSVPGAFALYEDMKTLEKTLRDRLKELADMISSEEDTYSDKSTYAIGDYCIHDNQLYKCIVSIREPEEWTEEHWRKVTIIEELLYLANKEVEVVDPKTAKVEGLAADAKLTGNALKELSEKILSFEQAKSTIVNSALGRALSMAASNTWAQIVSKISNVANRGTLNWSGSNATYAVPAGYYSGGTLDSRPSYNAGYAKGKADEAASHGGSRSGSFRVTVSSSNNTVDRTITFDPSFSNTPRCRVESTQFLGAEIIEITKLYMVIRCKYATQSSIGGDVVNGTVTWWAFAE